MSFQAWEQIKSSLLCQSVRKRVMKIGGKHLQTIQLSFLGEILITTEWHVTFTWYIEKNALKYTILQLIILTQRPWLINFTVIGGTSPMSEKVYAKQKNGISQDIHSSHHNLPRVCSTMDSSITSSWACWRYAWSLIDSHYNIYVMSLASYVATYNRV